MSLNELTINRQKGLQFKILFSAGVWSGEDRLEARTRRMDVSKERVKVSDLNILTEGEEKGFTTVWVG